MANPDPETLRRGNEYLRRHALVEFDRLGEGKDGAVLLSSRPSAVKVHQQLESYLHERAAYIRFRELSMTAVGGFRIPMLLDYHDDLRVIEMSVVSPPFIVDFASARLDFDPELIEDEGNTLEDFVRSRFDDRTDQVMAIYHELIARAGIFLTDLHPHNIKFAPRDPTE